MISISKNVCIDRLDDIVNEYNNTYHRTIKMKPVDVKDNIYIYIYIYISVLIKKIIRKILKFKVVHCVRISKCKNNFTKGYTPNLSEEIFVIKKVKNTVP